MLSPRLLTTCIIMAATSCLPVVCTAQTPDDDIIITSREQTFAFKISGKNVVLEESSTTDYLCLKPGRIVVAEFYDNLSRITRVGIKGVKSIKPQYEMYRSDEFFYSDMQVCYFTLPLRTKGESAQVIFGKRFNDIHLLPKIHLAKPQFMRSGVVKIAIPAWMQADIVERNLGPNIRKEVWNDPGNNTTNYSYTIESQPAVVHEDNSPGYSLAHPYLMIVPKTAMVGGVQTTYFNDFKDLYRWYRDIAGMASNDMEIVGAQALAITAACGSDKEKIAELYAWVQNNIRYVAYEDGLAGFKPDNAHEVLRKKYGDCKGMSNLLKALLTAEGFDARLAWIGTRETVFDESAALPTADHMICALRWNGKTWFLDPTVKYMAPGECHEAIQGKPAMIENGEDYLLETVPDFPPHANTDSLHCVYRIEGTALAAKGMMCFTGESKQYVMSAIYSTESHRREDVIRKYLECGRVEDKVDNFCISGADPKSNLVELNFSETRRSGIQFSDEEIYVAMDYRKDFLFSFFDTEKRKTDFKIPFRERTVRYERLEIPDGYSVSRMPGNSSIEGPGYTISIDYSTEGNSVVYHKVISITGALLRKSDFATWNRDMAALKRCYMQQVVLKKH